MCCDREGVKEVRGGETLAEQMAEQIVPCPYFFGARGMGRVRAIFLPQNCQGIFTLITLALRCIIRWNKDPVGLQCK